jgi:hypothetical protein
MGDDVIRAGVYAKFNGEFYKANLARVVGLTLAESISDPGEGWSRSRFGSHWVRVVPRSSLESLIYVHTWAVLDGYLPVRVEEVDVDSTLAVVQADYPPGGYYNRYQTEHPLHPDLYYDNSYNGSRDWGGEVATGRLTDVIEVVEDIPVDSERTQVHRPHPEPESWLKMRESFEKEFHRKNARTKK